MWFVICLSYLRRWCSHWLVGQVGHKESHVRVGYFVIDRWRRRLRKIEEGRESAEEEVNRAFFFSLYENKIDRWTNGPRDDH